MVELARPWVLFLLLPLGWWVVVWWRSTTWALPQGLPAPPQGGAPAEEMGSLHPPLPWLLRSLGLGALVLALAGPRVPRSLPLPPQEGVAIVVAMDLSGSMGIRDLDGRSRLEVAREEVLRFVEARPRDRIGLVTFAGEALTRVPPTTTHRYLREVVRSLEVSPVDDGTALGVGLGLAAHRLQSVDSPSRVVILVTDGRSNAGAVEPLPVAEAAGRLGVRIHAVGLGGEVGEDPLNEALLQTIAGVGGGRYFQASDPVGLQKTLTAIDELEKGPVARAQAVDYRSLHHGILMVGALLLLLESLAWIAPGARIG